MSEDQEILDIISEIDNASEDDVRNSRQPSVLNAVFGEYICQVYTGPETSVGPEHFVESWAESTLQEKVLLVRAAIN